MVAAKKSVVMIIVLLGSLSGLAGCFKDPVQHEKELRMQIAAASRLIENYRNNKYDGVEQLEEWKKNMETELDELAGKK